MDLLIVTGMSGAGKSQAVNALEDIGYYCVDNVPPSLLVSFADISKQSRGKITKIALVVDVRSHDMFDEYLSRLEELREKRYEVRTLFLDCDDRVIHTRYKETRRRHPLLREENASLTKAIAEERQMLEPARHSADSIIDTSLLSAQQLRTRIAEQFSGGDSPGMMITAQSFGFKYGLPADSDLVFDVRCLANPFYVPELRNLVGTDRAVWEYVMSFEAARGLEEKLMDLLDYLIPLYIREGKSQLVISVGCTGGKHRSVVFAERIGHHLMEKGISVGVSHRDIRRGQEG